MDFKSNQKFRRHPGTDFESYFKIGISNDYILLRDDFPIEEISPGDFKKLLIE